MRRLILLLAVMLIAGCGYRKPATHEPVIRSFAEHSRQQTLERLIAAMESEGIPIRTSDPARGLIVSDSFDVLPEYCDCGKNLLGAEFPGERRGVMRVQVTGGDNTTVRFEFTTKLKILANQKILICQSLGILEERILANLE